MAAILWKIKQKYDMFRRRQRLFVEMEQMASRPFSQVMKTDFRFIIVLDTKRALSFQVLVDIESREMLEISSAVENISNVQKKRKKVCEQAGIYCLKD